MLASYSQSYCHKLIMISDARRTLVLESRLPTVGTTIFTVMSSLAVKHDAVNLGQGFPDFNCDQKLIQQVTSAMEEGQNQYPPMAGAQPLRQAIASKIQSLYEYGYSSDTEITVTAGATQAIFTTILAVVHPGDEVIVLEPCYDSYAPSIELAGGITVAGTQTNSGAATAPCHSN